MHAFDGRRVVARLSPGARSRALGREERMPPGIAGNLRCHQSLFEFRR